MREDLISGAEMFELAANVCYHKSQFEQHKFEKVTQKFTWSDAEDGGSHYDIEGKGDRGLIPMQFL
tara:strand:- start:3944 stop:4141 length:198 start_codon:yes stop_codon:yes gene_type:complete